MANQEVGVEDDEEDNMDFVAWTPVSSGRGRGRGRGRNRRDEGNVSLNSKRGLEGNSSEEDVRVVRQKVTREEFKIILRFRKEDEHVNLSPITLSRELKKKIGEVEMAKILRDGNLLIICKTEIIWQIYSSKNREEILWETCHRKWHTSGEHYKTFIVQHNDK